MLYVLLQERWYVILCFKCQGTCSHSPFNWVYFPHLSCYNLGYRTRRTANRRHKRPESSYLTLNGLLYQLIAFNSFFFLFLNVTSSMSWQALYYKVCVSLFCFRKTRLWCGTSGYGSCPQELVPTRASRELQTGRVRCVKSGRPVILTTTFADCGRFSKCF